MTGRHTLEEGWKEKPLGDVLALFYGKSLPEKDREPGPYPVFGSNGIVGYHKAYAVPGPGIIVGRKGSCGEVHYCTQNFWPIDTTYYVQAKQDNNLRFLAYLLSSLGLNQLNSHSTIPGLNRERVYRISTPLPPLPEQKKIAAILLKLQQAISAQDKIHQSLRDLKKSTMQHLFTHGLRGEKTKMTEIGEIPESWEVVKLGGCCAFLSGGTPRKSRSDFWGGTIPWASPKDMKQERLSDTQDHITQLGLESGSCLAPAGCLFIVVRGMILVKNVPVALAEMPMAFNQDMKAILPDKTMDSGFVLFALQVYRPLLFQKVGRSAHGTRTLLSDTIAAFLIPKPQKEDQSKIARRLHLLERKAVNHELKKRALQALFNTTLNKLMTGDMRVADLEIDVKEVEG